MNRRQWLCAAGVLRAQPVFRSKRGKNRTHRGTIFVKTFRQPAIGPFPTRTQEHAVGAKVDQGIGDLVVQVNAQSAS
jgi:hypothetical protein